MPIEVEVPEVGIIEFPDDSTEAEINNALRNQFWTEGKPASQLPVIPQKASELMTLFPAAPLVVAEEADKPVIRELRSAGFSRKPSGMEVPVVSDVGRILTSQGKFASGLAQEAANIPAAIAGYSRIGETMRALSEGKPTPVQKRLEESGWAGIPARGALGLVESLPKVAAVGAAGALGGPLASTAAAGTIFGMDDEGKLTPRGAAIGAAFPAVGKIGRMAGAEFVRAMLNTPLKEALLDNPGLQKSIEFAAEQAFFNGFTTAADAGELAKMKPDEALKQVALSAFVNLGMSLMNPKVFSADQMSETEKLLAKTGEDFMDRHVADPAFAQTADQIARLQTFPSRLGVFGKQRLVPEPTLVPPEGMVVRDIPKLKRGIQPARIVDLTPPEVPVEQKPQIPFIRPPGEEVRITYPQEPIVPQPIVPGVALTPRVEIPGWMQTLEMRLAKRKFPPLEPPAEGGVPVEPPPTPPKKGPSDAIPVESPDAIPVRPAPRGSEALAEGVRETPEGAARTEAEAAQARAEVASETAPPPSLPEGARTRVVPGTAPVPESGPTGVAAPEARPTESTPSLGVVKSEKGGATYAKEKGRKEVPVAPAIIDAWQKGDRAEAQHLADTLPEVGEVWNYRTSTLGNLEGFGAGDPNFTRDLKVRGKPLWEWLNDQRRSEVAPSPAEQPTPAAPDWSNVDAVTDPFHKYSWLEKIANAGRKVNDTVLVGVLDRLEQIEPEVGNNAWNVAWAVAQNPVASPATKARALALRENWMRSGREVATPDQPSPAKAKEPWEMTRDNAIDSYLQKIYGKNLSEMPLKHRSQYYTVWGDAHLASIKKAISEGKPVPPEVLAEYGLKPTVKEHLTVPAGEGIGGTVAQKIVGAIKGKGESGELVKPSLVGKTITRFTHKDGRGLLDRTAIDLSKLTENEELELPELLDYGLQQPQGVPGGHKFYFTDEGLAKHKKLLRLIGKASKSGGLVKEKTTLKTEPSWASADGQIAVAPQAHPAKPTTRAGWAEFYRRQLDDPNATTAQKAKAQRELKVIEAKEKPGFAKVPVGSVDSPAQGMLNQARELKKRTWEQVKRLRQKVKDSGLYAGNFRLDLLKAEDAHREALRMERDALSAIESRANELAQTIKPTPPPSTTKSAVAKVEAEVSDVAKTEGKREAKEVKTELVQRLEKALEEAPSTVDVEGPQKTITIDIPGDGTFTLANTKENIQYLLNKARRLSVSSEKYNPLTKTFESDDTTSPRKSFEQKRLKAVSDLYGETPKAYEVAKSMGLRPPRKWIMAEDKPTPPPPAEGGKPRLQVLTEKLESGEPLTKPEQAEYKQLRGTAEEAAKPEVEAGTADKIIASLKKRRVKPPEPGVAANPIDALARNAWNGAIEIGIKAVETGKSIAEAVEAAIKFLHDKFGTEFKLDAEMRQDLERSIANKQYDQPTPQPVIPETPKVVSRARLAEGFETIPKGNEAREMAYGKEVVDRHGTNYEAAWAEIRAIEDQRTKAVAEATLMARMAEGRKPGDPIDPLLVSLQERVGTAAKDSWSAAGARLQAQHPVIRILEPYLAYYSWLGILRGRAAEVVDKAFGPDAGLKIADAYGTAGVDAKTFRREFAKRVPLPNVGKADMAKLENAMPEIIKLADMGLLDNEAFRRALGKEYGIEDMTGPTARKLMDLSTAYKNAPEGLQRDKVMLQMANTLADAANVKPWQLAQDYWYASVLFRAGTWLNVAVGSGLTAPFFTAGMAIDRMARMDPMGAMRVLHQLLSGLGEGALVAQQIARRGDYYLLHDFPARFRGVIDGTKKADSLEALLRKGGLAGNTIGRLAFTRRIMTALDYGFAIGGRNAALAYSLMTRGDQAGLRALSRKWDADANRQAHEQAVRELGPGATRAELIVRRHQILEQGISEQSKEVASLIGQRIAQNAEPTGLGYYVYKMASALPFFLKAPAGLAFVRAGANMAANVADAYPLLGLGRAALGKVAESKISKLGEEGAAPWKHFLNTPEERRIQVALQGAGMAATGLLAGYFLSDDKDKAMDITGPWAGVSPMEAKVLRGKGERPLSIGFKRKDGSTTWVNYRNTPLLPILAAVGWVRDKQRFDAKKFEKMDAPSVLMNAYLSGVMSIKDIASIGGITALFNQQAGTIDEPANALNRAVGQAAGRFSAGFIPSMVSELDQFTDPSLYQPTKGEMLGYWLRNYPFVRKMVGQGPALDILGDPIAQTKPPLRQYLQSEHRNDKAWKVLNRAMEQGTFPTYAAERQVVDNGVKRDMTEPEKYRYQKFFGQELRTAIENNASTLLTFNRDQLTKWFHNNAYWEPRKAAAARRAVTKK